MSHPYKLYLDDSGTKEYSATGYGAGVTRYFCFGGLLMPVSQAQFAARQMRTLKSKYFGRDDIEVKSNWLRIPRERQKRYLDQCFGLTEAGLTEFVGQVYDLIIQLRCELLCCVVDKEEMQRRYSQPWYAPAAAYESIIQRVQMHMNEVDGMASVTIDAMSGATPAGNQYHDNLVRHHRQLRTSGSRLQPGLAINRIGDLGFAESHHDERIQLADIVAYNAYRQFVDYDGNVDDPAHRYAHFGRLSPKFRQHRGAIAGYGVVAFPR